MVRVGGGCQWGGEEEREGGGCNKLGRGRGGRLGLGRRGGAPIHRIEINGPNSLSCTRGNEARDVSAESSQWRRQERPRGARSGAPLACGEGPRLSIELLDRGAWPSRGLPLAYGHQRGLVGTLRGSGYLGKNISVIHESLHLYLALYLPHLY
jgi:hypothetical protein